jgi:hypothetical protein
MWPARFLARVLIARFCGALAENGGFGHDPMIRSLKEVEFAPRRIVVEFQAQEYAKLEERIGRSVGPGAFLKALVLRELERAVG